MTYTLGTICARGGSQGMPAKNVKKLAGHPLIAYSIAPAKRCAFIDRLVVSTDDADIARVARDYPHQREGARHPARGPRGRARDRT